MTRDYTLEFILISNPETQDQFRSSSKLIQNPKLFHVKHYLCIAKHNNPVNNFLMTDYSLNNDSICYNLWNTEYRTLKTEH